MSELPPQPAPIRAVLHANTTDVRHPLCPNCGPTSWRLLHSPRPEPHIWQCLRCGMVDAVGVRYFGYHAFRLDTDDAPGLRLRREGAEEGGPGYRPPRPPPEQSSPPPDRGKPQRKHTR